MASPTGYQVWCRFRRAMDWFPLLDAPGLSDYCEEAAASTRYDPLVQSCLVLPWGELPGGKIERDSPVTEAEIEVLRLQAAEKFGLSSEQIQVYERAIQLTIEQAEAGDQEAIELVLGVIDRRLREDAGE